MKHTKFFLVTLLFIILCLGLIYYNGGVKKDGPLDTGVEVTDTTLIPASTTANTPPANDDVVWRIVKNNNGTEVALLVKGKKPRVIGSEFVGECSQIDMSEKILAFPEFRGRGVPISFVECSSERGGIQFGAFRVGSAVEISPREFYK